MSTQESQLSTYGRYVGRVGALAAALGIGMFAVTTPGVAAADSTTSTSSSTSESRDASTTGSASPSSRDAGGGNTTSKSSGSGQSEADDTGSEADGADAASTEDAASPDTEQDDTDDAAEPGSHVTGPDVNEPDVTEPDVTEPVVPESDSPEVDASPSTPPRTPERAGTGWRLFRAVERDTPSAPSIPSTPSSPTPAADDNVATAAEQSAPAAAPSAARTTATATADNGTAEAPSVTATVVSATAVAPTLGVIGFLNNVVTKLLDPFLAAPPNTPGPVTPIVWTVLGWVRRNLFNQAPVITYNPATTSQTGQTVSGSLGAADAEGDPLTYTVTQGPEHGTLTIDQATGHFTYTPDDIDYAAAQTDSFTISVADGKINLLTLFRPHRASKTIDLTVQNPEVTRTILNLPADVTSPQNPRFAADGDSILFHAAPAAGGRRELYQVDIDGTHLRCLTCGISPEVTADLGKMVPFEDGTGRILVEAGSNKWMVYEEDAQGRRLVPIVIPPGPPAPARVIESSREMRVSLDGSHVLFSQIQLGQGGVLTAVPVVGTFTRATDATEYRITDARVVYGVGEGKQFTHDGKGVIIIGGQYDAGNVDDIVVDLATGKVTRLTGNLDYDEDTDLSPNGKWIAIGSTRTLDALTPMSRIVRPAFLPAQIQGAVYEAYAKTINVTNQEWLIAVEDDLARENGTPLFVSDDPSTPQDEGDGYTARSMPSWNQDGTAVTFYERLATADPTLPQTRIVVARLNYTTSVGTAQGDQVTPDPTWAPKLSEYVPSPAVLPATGTYPGTGGGTALITEDTTTSPGHTIRTVTYTDYVNEDGLILNGTEWTDATASQNSIRYVADIAVTGAHTGYLKGDVTINKLTRSITPTIAPVDPASKTGTAADPGSQIRSSLDGDLLVLLDPNRIAAAQAGV